MELFREDSLYISTTDGLFRAGARSGEHVHSQLCGLRGKGALTGAAVEPGEPRRICVGTAEAGVYLSEDGGNLWRESERGVSFSSVSTLFQHPRSREIYVGTTPAALHR